MAYSLSEIIVLARLFAQLDHLETEFLARKIPYRVDGQEPFFKRSEINTLLDYIRLARDYHKPLNEQIGGWLLNVANKPSRMLSRSLLGRIISSAKYRGLSVQQALFQASADRNLDLRGWQIDKLADLSSFLDILQEEYSISDMKAGKLLDWMTSTLDYLEYFQDYYGKGEHAEEKKYAVLNFIHYITQLNLSPNGLLEHLARLDTTQGQPEDQQIVFTTIFRTKGLEYDYVILPQCEENLFPYLRGECNDVYDTEGIFRGWQMSGKLESERRLFYVALTRARKGVLIGTSPNNPSRFLDEVSLENTDAVMNAVKQLAYGEPNAVQMLTNALNNNSPQPNLLENLVKGYLPDLGYQSLATQLQQDWRLQPQTIHTFS